MACLEIEFSAPASRGPRMSGVASICLLLVGVLTFACQSQPQVPKEKPWGGWPKGDISLSPPEKDAGEAVAEDTADTVSGATIDASGLPAPSTGTLLRRTYGSNNDEEALGLARTGDGGLALVGYTDGIGAGDRDLLLIRTDGCGVRKWTHSFGGAMFDEGRAVSETPDGGLIAVGLTASFQGGVDVYLVRTDAAGNAVWTATLGGPQADEGYALADAGDGSYVVVGKTYKYMFIGSGKFNQRVSFRVDKGSVGSLVIKKALAR